MDKHTPGPYFRDGSLVYALMDDPSPSPGMPKKINRFMAGVQPCGPGSANADECRAVAKLFRQASALLTVARAAKELRTWQHQWENADHSRYLPTPEYVNQRKKLQIALDAALAEVKI